MPKPTTKNQILEAAQTERAALEELLATLTFEQMTQPNVIGEWAIKDVLAHLIEWEQMVVEWYETGVKGEVPAVPSKNSTGDNCHNSTISFTSSIVIKTSWTFKRVSRLRTRKS